MDRRAGRTCPACPVAKRLKRDHLPMTAALPRFTRSGSGPSRRTRREAWALCRQGGFIGSTQLHPGDDPQTTPSRTRAFASSGRVAPNGPGLLSGGGLALPWVDLGPAGAAVRLVRPVGRSSLTATPADQRRRAQASARWCGRPRAAGDGPGHPGSQARHAPRDPPLGAVDSGVGLAVPVRPLT